MSFRSRVGINICVLICVHLVLLFENLFGALSEFLLDVPKFYFPYISMRFQDGASLQASAIHPKGCIYQGDEWFKHYIIPIAGSVVAVAVIQVEMVSLLCFVQ